MPCPTCESDDWRLASLVYQEGLVHVSANTTGGTVGMSKAGVGIGAVGAKTSGVHQTELSRQAAPPEGSSIPELFGYGIVIFGFLGWAFSSWWLLLAAGCAIGAVTTLLSESKERAAAMARWKLLRHCQRCGGFYSPLDN